MADRRTKKDAEPTGPAESTEPGPESGFENRAARRARGKGRQQSRAAAKIDAHGRRNPVQAPRSWATRRSG